jgi:hypothetical protein
LNGRITSEETSTDSKPERPTGPHDRRSISVSELAAMQRGYVERLGKVAEQLEALMQRTSEPNAAFGETESVQPWEVEPRGGLTREPLRNGDAGYHLVAEFLRSTVGRISRRPRLAFVVRGAENGSPYVKLIGTKDHELGVAVAFAAERWEHFEVIIRPQV